MLESQDAAVVLQPQTVHAQLPALETPQPTSQPTRVDTPSTTQPPSEGATSTTPTTPISASQTTPKPIVSQPHKSAKAIAPVPIVPIVPKQTSRPSSSTAIIEPKALEQAVQAASIPQSTNSIEPSNESQEAAVQNPQTSESVEPSSDPQDATAQTPAGPPKPFSWANLAKTPAAPAKANCSTGEKKESFARSNVESLVGALQNFDATTRDGKLVYLKPRGLVNRGNMCYMNSVLQVLVFCIPFYDFLDQIGRRASHSFQSNTPLIDAMIMFMREYPTITSAETVDKLKRQLRPEDSGDYGEQFAPDFVYDVVNKLPRFASMRVS